MNEIKGVGKANDYIIKGMDRPMITNDYRGGRVSKIMKN